MGEGSGISKSFVPHTHNTVLITHTTIRGVCKCDHQPNTFGDEACDPSRHISHVYLRDPWRKQKWQRLPIAAMWRQTFHDAPQSIAKSNNETLSVMPLKLHGTSCTISVIIGGQSGINHRLAAVGARSRPGQCRAVHHIKRPSVIGFKGSTSSKRAGMEGEGGTEPRAQAMAEEKFSASGESCSQQGRAGTRNGGHWPSALEKTKQQLGTR